jgi:hypothetical protein
MGFDAASRNKRGSVRKQRRIKSAAVNAAR